MICFANPPPLPIRRHDCTIGGDQCTKCACVRVGDLRVQLKSGIHTTLPGTMPLANDLFKCSTAPPMQLLIGFVFESHKSSKTETDSLFLFPSVCENDGLPYSSEGINRALKRCASA